MAGDDVAGFGAEDVVEAGLGAAFVAELLVEFEGVADAPAAEGVDDDVDFVFGGHAGGGAVPLEDAFFEAVDALDEGGFEVEAGLDDGVAHGLAELGDDDLLALGDGEEGGVEDEEGEDREEGGEGGEEGFHGEQ